MLIAIHTVICNYALNIIKLINIIIFSYTYLFEILYLAEKLKKKKRTGKEETSRQRYRLDEEKGNKGSMRKIYKIKKYQHQILLV